MAEANKRQGAVYGMKKLISMALSITVLFLITACGNSKESQNVNIEPETVPESELQTEIQPEEAALKNTAMENTEQEVTEMKMKIQVGDTILTAGVVILI